MPRGEQKKMTLQRCVPQLTTRGTLRWQWAWTLTPAVAVVQVELVVHHLHPRPLNL